ncbi:MFS transporter [Arthrobacter sp. H14-L1]|uniref:MFS transporter n=1 Tax=Arthrobacter sp. H14-L1 TaxID=2996697 RepID=UPI002270A94F|nr:MFS transporter [Arthrobacter sp. H14-L1]MCY0905495.1 MFS transporter [Arthrobacter sp. H14-L1]
MTSKSRSLVAQSARPALPHEISVLIAAAFVIALGFGLVAPVLPQFARSFDVSVSAAAVVVSAFAFARLVFAPFSGQLVERFGERWIYITGILIVALSSAACAFAGDYWQLLIFRGLGGVGSTMFTVAAMGLLVRLTPAGARGRVNSAYAGSFLLGNIAGPAAGALMAGLGLKLPFLIYAGTLLVAATVVATSLRPARLARLAAAAALAAAGSTAAGSMAASTTAGSTTAAASPLPPLPPPAKKPPMQLREALDNPSYRAALVSAFANGWSAFGIRMALVPLFATVVLHGGTAVAGISLAVFAIGTGAALTFSGRLADTRGRKPMVVTGLAVNTAAMAVLGFTTNVPIFFVVSAIAGVGSGLFGPAQQSSVADIIGSDRSGGKVLATFQMSQDLGTILGPIAAGVIVDAFSYGAAFGMAAAVGAIAILAWLKASETLQRSTG